jgi:uncharacterized lipoprotein YmbA
MKWVSVALVACLLAACGTEPKKTAFNNSAVVAKKKDQVWESALDYFTRNNIQIKTIEKDSGVIYAERASFEESMADCGEQPIARELARTATLNVFVRPQPSGTQVSVNTTFAVVRTFDGQTWKTECFSTGLLERQILNSVG